MDKVKRMPRPEAVVDEVPLSRKMLAAVSGSVLTSLLMTPLDVVRVRLQSQQPSSRSGVNLSAHAAPANFHKLPADLGVTTCCREVFWVNNNQYCIAEGNLAEVGAAAIHTGECAVQETQRNTFNSTLDGLRKIARNEGITTLWRGLSPTLVMAVPANVIYFAGYDWLRTSSRSPMKRVSDAYAPLIAGSSARMLAAFVVSPVELIRTRMQASHSSTAAENFKETMAGVSEMVKTRGYRSLWRGLTLMLWRDVPFSALYWWGYESTRNVLSDARAGRGRGAGDSFGSLAARRSESRSRQSHSSTLVDSFIAGGVSGAVASLVTTPFDVGKTRVQVAHHKGDIAAAAKDTTGDVGKTLRPEQRSIPRFLWHIWKSEGAPGLFKGWAARCLKVAPACAIMISSYEIGKKMAGKPKVDNDSE